MIDRSIVTLLAAAVFCAACNLVEEDDPASPMLAIDDPASSPTFSVGGTVAGATGPFVLLNSNGMTLNVTSDGSFAFETRMVPSALYNVTVAVPPKSQTCVVANGAGMIELGNISDITVTCTPTTYTAGNTVAGDFP